MQTQRLTLEELELSSFVTSMPEDEQMAIVGACWWWASWFIVEQGRRLIKAYAEYTSTLPVPESFETSPGFFDTDYPCG